jgi:hypothetical protein
MRETPPLFTYGTGVSLRTPERRASSRLALLIAGLLLATALVAGLALAAFLWLATADYAAMLNGARELLASHLSV